MYEQILMAAGVARSDTIEPHLAGCSLQRLRCVLRGEDRGRPQNVALTALLA